MLRSYGIIGTEGDLDADKIYDYHTLYKPDVGTAMTINVDLDMNYKKITNVPFDYNDNDSIASVKMAKDLSIHTRLYIYRSIFEHVYNLLDTTLFNLINGVSGIVINQKKSKCTF